MILDRRAMRAKAKNTDMSRFIEGRLPMAHRLTYTLAVPDVVAPATGHALVAALHGKGDDGAALRARLADWESAPFAALWLDAPWPIESGNPPRLGRSWYAYAGDDAAFREELLRMAAIVVDAVRTVATTHGLDLGRCGLFGYSQGGYLAGVAAMAHPKAFRGLAVASARIKTEMFDGALAPLRGFPVLALHGRRDPHVSFDRQVAAVDVLRTAEVDATIVAHDGGHGLRSEAGSALARFFTEVFARTP